MKALVKQKQGNGLQQMQHKYGFIMRYPKGKEKITGYMYEPWHFRYIGEEQAGKVHESKLTLEEYLNMQLRKAEAPITDHE